MKKFILFIIFCSSFLYSQDKWGVQILTKDNQTRGGNSFTSSWLPALLDTNYYQSQNIIADCKPSYKN